MLIPLFAVLVAALCAWAALVTLPALALCKLLSRALVRFLKGS